MSKQINYSKDFVKNYKKYISPNPKLLQRFKQRLRLFSSHRSSPVLRDHALVGSKIGLRSFSITGDFRIIYVEETDRFYFLDIGRHSQVY